MRSPPALLLPLVLLASSCSQSTPSDGSPNAGVSTSEDKSVATTGAKTPEPLPDTVRVRLDTEEGPITLALDAKHAPITTANFIRYVDAHRFDGTFFYRAARRENDEKEGYIQGGIRHNYRRMYPPIPHEPTSKTGLRHVAGTISMASTAPGSAMGDFFIITHAMPDLDAHKGDAGYAAFGKVIDGMATVRKILASPTFKGGSGAMKGQLIERPVRIVKAARVE